MEAIQEITSTNQDMQDLFNILGHELFTKVCQHFAGEQVYFPKGLQTQVIHEQIRKDYAEAMRDSRAVKTVVCGQLAARYGFSVRWVERLV